MGEHLLGSQPESESCEVTLHRDVFIIRIEFNAFLVKAIKDIPGRWYFSPERSWFIPPHPESTAALCRLIESNGLSITESDGAELWRIARLYESIYSDPQLGKLERYVYRAASGDTLFYFPKVGIVAEAIEDLVRGVWDKRIGTYRVPATPHSAETILAIAEEYNFFVEPEEYQRLLILSDQRYESDLEIDYFSIIDRTIFQLLARLPEQRRENIIQAARSYRL